MTIKKVAKKTGRIAIDVPTFFLGLTSSIWILYVLISRIKLSSYQIDIDDILLLELMLVVPLSALLAFLLLRAQLISVAQETVNKHEISDKFVWVSISIIGLIFFCDILINGVPALAETPEQVNEERLSVRIPFLYSFAYAMAKVLSVYLVIGIGIRNRALAIVSLCAIMITQGMLTVSRGAIISFFVPVSICVFAKIKSQFKWPILILGFLITLELFSIAGRFREGGTFSIAEYGGFSNDIYEPLAWLWGYVFVNIDNLALVASDAHDFEFKSLYNFSPTLWLYFGRDISADADLPYITKFNLSTGYGYLTYDFGLYGAVFFTTAIFLLYSYVSTRAKYSLNWQVCKVLVIYGIIMFPITNIFLISSSVMLLLALMLISLFISRPRKSNF